MIKHWVIPVIILFLEMVPIFQSQKASDQLLNWGRAHSKDRPVRATDFRGAPVPTITSSLSVGKTSGPILLADSNMIEILSRFNRERIPERSVHAKGAGAYGYFKVTHDITKYTKAKLFSKIGKKTQLIVRFSTVSGEFGSSDTVVDMRGFALKFKTEDGNYDLLGIQIPIFPIRDPALFASFNHARKRNPATHLADDNMRWDFGSRRPETVFSDLFLYSGLGSPDGYRHMDGFGVQAFKLVNSQHKTVYCKFHWRTNQGVRNLTAEQMATINGDNFDYAIEDLYNAIARKRFPSWRLYIQVMSLAWAKRYRWNPFDSTKIWLEEDFPLIPVGEFVLNRNPDDYFTEVEQIGFGAGNLIPGIEPGLDKMLHARLFVYADAQRYRLGPNRGLIGVNSPRPGVHARNYDRDGAGIHYPEENGNGGPNYYPNSFDGVRVDPKAKERVYHLHEDVVRHDSVHDDNFSQATWYWNNIFSHREKEIIADNIVRSLKNAYKFIQRRAVKNFGNVSPDLAEMIQIGLARENLTKNQTVYNYR